MAIQTMNTAAPRIGRIKGEILAHAIPHLVLSISAEQKQIGKNVGDVYVARRWLPKGATSANPNRWSVDPAAHQVSEGVTPTAETLAPQDVSVQIQQYACLYSYTDKVAELYEDKIPDYIKEQVGQRMGLVAEMIDYGVLKSCSNKFYAGGTSRSTVDEAISLNVLRNVSRSLRGNHGSMVTRALSSSPNYATYPIEPSFLVFCHTDCEHDIRNLNGFRSTVEYGTRKVVHENEIGSCENFRFIVSAELNPIVDSGAAVGSTGLKSTSGSNIDVYPYIVVGANSWCQLALRGANSLDVIHVPHNQKDKNDPLGQRGYLGAKFYRSAFIQNDGWMAVVEAGVTDL